MSLPAPVADRVARLVGQKVTGWSPRTVGLTHAMSGVATFSDSSTFFVKAATEEHSTAEMQREIVNLSQLEATFLPEVIAAEIDPSPILVLEDLSEGYWPLPYPSDLAMLHEALAELRSLVAPDRLKLRRLSPPDDLWDRVVPETEQVVPELGNWIAQHAEVLSSAALGVAAGDALVHTDLWYSNICFLADRVVFVDWSHAHTGSPWWDSSTINVDLAIERRPPVEMEEAGGWAATHVAWATRALANGPGPSISQPRRWIRENLELVDGAVRWAAAELDLPVPPPVEIPDIRAEEQ